MKKIKILHVITRLVQGGADENTFFTVDGLNPERYETDLAYGVRSEVDKFLFSKDIKLLFIPSLVRHISPFRDLHTLYLLYRLLRKTRYHIIHTHTAKAGILGRFAAKLAGVPIIIHSLHGATFHDSISKSASFFYKLMEKTAAKYTDKIISVGDDLKKIYINNGIGKASQYITIRSGFDLSKFLLTADEIRNCKAKLCKELGFDEHSIIIGTASRLEARKGHIYLINAAKRIILNHPNAHFVFAGSGALEKDLKEIVASNNLSNRIHFLGFRRDINTIIAAYDIFVLTSLWEGLPRVLVQAAALQKPIITFDVEGASEIVENGRNGYIIKKKDIDSLSQKLDELISNPSRCQVMGRESLSKVNAEWEKQVMVDKIAALYSELVCKRFES